MEIGGVERFPAEGAEFGVADLFVAPAAFASFVGNGFWGQGKVEFGAEDFIDFALRERAGIGEIENFAARGSRVGLGEKLNSRNDIGAVDLVDPSAVRCGGGKLADVDGGFPFEEISQQHTASRPVNAGEPHDGYAGGEDERFRFAQNFSRAAFGFGFGEFRDDAAVDLRVDAGAAGEIESGLGESGNQVPASFEVNGSVFGFGSAASAGGAMDDDLDVRKTNG